MSDERPPVRTTYSPVYYAWAVFAEFRRLILPGERVPAKEYPKPANGRQSLSHWLWMLATHLATVDSIGTGGGGGDYLPLEGGMMEPGATIHWANGSMDREISGDTVGREIVCSVGYRWQWRAGRMRLLNISDQVIRILAVDAPPQAYDDAASGVTAGCVYETADGQKWVCEDPTEGAAVWVPWQVPVENIPAIAVVEYLGPVANESAMLALVGQSGDWCVRSDEGKVYVITGEDPTQLSSWTALTYPALTQAQWDALLGTSSAFSNALAGKLNAIDLKFIDRFSPRENEPPAANFALVDNRNAQRVLTFSDSVDQFAIFPGVVPPHSVLTSGIIVRAWVAAASATTGQARITAALERQNTDMDADSFGPTVEVNMVKASDSGVWTRVDITLTDIDGLQAGEPFRIRWGRKASDTVNDTLVGLLQLARVEVRTAN